MNVITLEGPAQEIQGLLNTILKTKGDEKFVDFNELIPMPEDLNIQSGSKTIKGLHAYTAFVDECGLEDLYRESPKPDIPSEQVETYRRAHPEISTEEWDLGKRAFENKRQYGFTDWYDWRCKNWGTKWVGYDARLDSANKFRFSTAWNAPHPVVEEIARRHPNLHITHRWAGENLGSALGERVYENGKIVEEDTMYFDEYSSVDRMEFALDVWDCKPSDVGLVLNSTGTWYIGAEDEVHDVVEVFGTPALYTIERLTAEAIPQGMYCYHLRENDNGNGFVTIEPSVAVNHGGTLITKTPLDFGEKGYIPLTDETTPNFTGEYASFGEFMRDYPVVEPPPQPTAKPRRGPHL